MKSSFSVKKEFTIVFGIIFLVFVIFGGTLLYQIWPIDSKTVGQSGSFGDSFGVLTALFSALAFGALIITLRQQQDDLSLTRQEMKEQQFESILFKMLEIHSTIVADIDLMKYDDSKRYQFAIGRDCFFYFRLRLKKRYDKNKSLEKSYTIWWKRNRVNLSHYLRYLYNMYKIIDTSNNTEENKKKYANIVRAQLSDYELCVIFYNCISKNGENFTPLAIKYSLFDNLPEELLFDTGHKDKIEKKAFGE